MTCMTTKQKFDVENPDVVVLKNNRYAYRAECPWKSRTGRDLVAYKFCSAKAYLNYLARCEPEAQITDGVTHDSDDQA